MTKEEAVKILEKCKEKGFRYTLYTLDEYHEALDMAIKALEQEPFINKPCVSQGICHEDKVKVLEDIKAELKRMADNEWNQQVGSSKGLEEAIEVVEKYMD